MARYNKIRFQKPTLLFLHFDNTCGPYAKLYGQLIVTFSLACVLIQSRSTTGGGGDTTIPSPGR